MSVAKRREREKEARRTRILGAAEETFRAKGFGQATMDDIAAAAELSKGTLYLYFKSKDDLFVEMASRFLESLAVDFEAIADREQDGVAGLTAMMSRYADRVGERPHLFRTMVGSMASGERVDCSSPVFDRHRALIARVVAVFARLLARGVENGSLRPDLDPVQTATRLWGGMLGVILVRLSGDDVSRRFPARLDLDAFVPGYLDLIGNGLRPRASAPPADADASPPAPPADASQSARPADASKASPPSAASQPLESNE